MTRESIKLGDATYYIRPMGAFGSVRVLGELQQKFGPGLSELLEDGLALSGPALAAAVTRLSMALPGAEMERLAKLLLDPECVSVEVTGEPAVKLDAVAQARHLRGAHDLIRLCIEIALVNYRPFWAEEGSLFGKGRALLARLSPPAPTAPN